MEVEEERENGFGCVEVEVEVGVAKTTNINSSKQENFTRVLYIWRRGEVFLTFPFFHA